MSVTVRAPAKINLTLRVGATGPGGFHALATIYQAIGLWDDVTVSEASEWSIRVRGDHAAEGVPTDETNLAWRAGVALRRHHDLAGAAARIEIHKGIPVAGGMAGGSADAAATLVALDRLWELDTSDADLLAIAATLGSDVPFALLGGTAAGTGRGEIVSQVLDNGQWWWVAVPDAAGLSTPAVYQEFDLVRERANAGLGVGPGAPSLPYPDEPQVSPEALAALVTGSADLLGEAMRNDLEEPALRLRPDLRATFETVAEAGPVRAMISGSGPTVLLLGRDVAHARAMQAALHGRGLASYVAPAPVAGAHVIEGG